MKTNTCLLFILCLTATVQIISCATQKGITLQNFAVQQRKESEIPSAISDADQPQKKIDAIEKSEPEVFSDETVVGPDTKSSNAVAQSEKVNKPVSAVETIAVPDTSQECIEKQSTQTSRQSMLTSALVAAPQEAQANNMNTDYEKTAGQSEKIEAEGMSATESDAVIEKTVPSSQVIVREKKRASEVKPQKEIAENRAALSSVDTHDELVSSVNHVGSEIIESTKEKSLADLITAFEANGSQYEYIPAPSFAEEMQHTFFSNRFSCVVSKEAETEPQITISRMASVSEKQRLEISYPGHGWVYIGEQTAQQGLRYEQRKLQNNTSTFTFSAEKKGNYVLHFSYFDVFSDDFITVAVAVSVLSHKNTGGMRKSVVQAPDYTLNGREEAPAENTGSPVRSEISSNTEAPLTAESIPVDTETAIMPDDLLEKAHQAVAVLDSNAALQYLKDFFAHADQNLDEGWFLLGRTYELNGPERNIGLALKAYKTVTELFPQSSYWNKADARIRYIKNFYVDIQ